MSGAGTAIIPRQHNGMEIMHRRQDRYIDAAAMCKAFGKRWDHYRANAGTQRFLEVLADRLGVPIQLPGNPGSLIQTKEGRDGYVYVHPHIAIHLSQWLSAEFAVLVSEWMDELLATGSVSLANVPVATPVVARPWSERLKQSFWDHNRLVNQFAATLGEGCFSVVTATIPDVLALEDVLLEHLLPVQDSDRPDGSIGLCWANWRRKQSRPPVTKRAKLAVPLGGGRWRDVEPLIYPAPEYTEFRHWFQNAWLPDNLLAYLLGKFRTEFTELPPASAADHVVLRLLGRHANLPGRVRKHLESRGGMAIAKQELPSKTA